MHLGRREEFKMSEVSQEESKAAEDELQQVKFLIQKFEDEVEEYLSTHRGLFNPPNRGYVQGIRNCIELMEEVVRNGGIGTYTRLADRQFRRR
jgi:hypothetical protein